MAGRVALPQKAGLEDDVSPEALEGCGMAAWWLEEFPPTIASSEEAYRAFRRRQDRAGAARMATWLANDDADYKGELAVCNGWIRLAERLLEHVPLVRRARLPGVTKAHFALMVHRDPVDPAGFEMVGVALEGLALVTEGAVGRLMGRRARRTEPPSPVSAMAKSSPISGSGEIQAARGA